MEGRFAGTCAYTSINISDKTSQRCSKIAFRSQWLFQASSKQAQPYSLLGQLFPAQFVEHSGQEVCRKALCKNYCLASGILPQRHTLLWYLSLNCLQDLKRKMVSRYAQRRNITLHRTSRGDPGFKSRMCPPYPHACRKRRLKWGAVI